VDSLKEYNEGYRAGTIDTYAERYQFDLEKYVRNMGVRETLEEVMKIGLLLEKEKKNESV
jgi:hypothetical protein